MELQDLQILETLRIEDRGLQRLLRKRAYSMLKECYQFIEYSTSFEKYAGIRNNKVKATFQNISEYRTIRNIALKLGLRKKKIRKLDEGVSKRLLRFSELARIFSIPITDEEIRRRNEDMQELSSLTLKKIRDSYIR